MPPRRQPRHPQPEGAASWIGVSIPAIPSAVAERRSGNRDVEAAPIRARLGDISRGGCYLATTSPPTVLTYIDLVLTLDEQRLQAKGQVVGCHPHFGMDVKFLYLSDIDRPVLEAWVAALAAKAGPPIGCRSGENPARALDKEAAAAVVLAVMEFFRSKPVMSREEFQQLLQL